MAKYILHSKEARDKILSGVEKLANVVSVTMGPQGRNVILGKYVGAPVITKDGVSVAREIVLDDPVEDLACQLVKEVAGRTADVAGDGTTTATVLAHEIVINGSKLMAEGYSPLDFKNGIEWATNSVIDNLNSIATDVNDFETIKNIASISANNDLVMGEKIAEAFEAVGLSGTVTAEACPGDTVSVRIIDGVELKNGYITPQFLTEPGKTEIVLENCKVLICDREITHLTDCLEMLNDLSNNSQPILILAKSVKQEALATLVANNKLGRIKVVAVEIPMFGITQNDWVEDLSILVGTKVCGPETGTPLRSLGVAGLGSAKKVIVGKYLTKILGGCKDEERLEEKMAVYKKDTTLLVGDKERLDIRGRMAFLNSKASVVSVGYATELELREKGDRLEDALNATRAALEEGVVPGGGVALIRAASMVNTEGVDERLLPAVNVLIDACARPLSQILSNGFLDVEKILSKVVRSKKVNYGYNAATNVFGDMFKEGVLDPKKVTRIALQNASSISLLLLNTESVVSEKPNDPSSWQPPAGWRPPQDGNLNHKY